MRPEPFAVLAAACILVGGVVIVVVPNPVEGSLWAAIAAVLGGGSAGVAFGLVGADVPDRDYTAVGSVLVAAVLALVLLAGRPAAGYVTALVGGFGAALVGLDSGLKRADG